MNNRSHLYDVIRKPIVWVPFLLILILLVGGIIYFLSFKPVPNGTNPNSVKYVNDYMGFSLVLPEDFEIYHTDRNDKNINDYSDLNIYVPTSDRFYSQEIQSYAKPIVVRVYNRESWDALKEDDPVKTRYLYQGIKGNKVYTIKFWENVPSDWSNKWNKQVEEFIISGFKIL
jgi:hypothetical protein